MNRFNNKMQGITNCGHKVTDYKLKEVLDNGMEVFRCEICGNEEIPESM